MGEVLAAFKITPTEIILICAGEKPRQGGNILYTDIGSFTESEYVVGWCSQCITEKDAYAIRIKIKKDCAKIKNVCF